MTWLRLAFLLLALINLVFYVWSQGYLGSTNDGREPQRLAAQVAPEKLRLVTQEQQQPEPPRESCRRASGLKAVEGERLLAAWQARWPSARIKLIPQETAPMYQITITGLPSRAAADTKLAEVRARGVKSEVTYANPAPDRFALIFATFRSEAGAREYLESFERQGIRSARIVTHRPTPTAAQIEVRGPEAVLTELPGLLKGIGGATLEECSPS